MIAFVMDINVNGSFIQIKWLETANLQMFMRIFLYLQYQGADENVDVEGFEEELEVDIF